MMGNLDTYKDLLRHMEWADATVWAAVQALPQSEPDAKLLGYLSHLHIVQQAFLLIWKGAEIGSTLPTFETNQVLLEWVRSKYPDLFAHLETVMEDDLGTPTQMPWAAMIEKRLGYKPQVPTLGETLLQVASHSTYHRGQANTRLRELGGEPPMVDYIAWIWMGRPAPNWPA